jgi:hypothetical protein
MSIDHVVDLACLIRPGDATRDQVVLPAAYAGNAPCAHQEGGVVPQAGRGFFQLGFGLFALRDVQVDAIHPFRFSLSGVRVKSRPRVSCQTQWPLLVAHAAFKFENVALALDVLIQALCGKHQVIGMQRMAPDDGLGFLLPLRASSRASLPSVR